MRDELLELQRLQFSDKERSEQRLKALLESCGVEDIASVALNPKPESLNSVNGFVNFADGTTLFFKSHVEENECLEEYYQHEVLESAKYPCITPNKVNSVPGEQIAFYEVIHFPTLFDLAKSSEDEQLGVEAEKESKIEGESSAVLSDAQRKLDRQIEMIYREQLRPLTEVEHAKAPIHQLFHHRLSEQGRVRSFYSGSSLSLPGEELNADELFRCHWTINGVAYEETLEELVQQARSVLRPQECRAAVLGHGDAHNGNVFWDSERESLKYFDPAFAGVHDVFLDITKPLFHNVFARWMYFPEEVDCEIELNYSRDGKRINIDHSFEPSKLRTEFFESKRDLVLFPLLEFLRSEKAKDRNVSLADNWFDYLKKALFCCPLLTINLALPYKKQGTVGERYTPEVRLLGLSLAIQMGAYASSGENRIANMIDSLRCA
jgi:hypothetical protein